MDEEGRITMPVLTVNVVDYNTNRPVSGAIVSINGNAVVTNYNGKAVFDADTSTYNLNVSSNNYTPENRLVVLSSNQNVTIRIIPRVGLL